MLLALFRLLYGYQTWVSNNRGHFISSLEKQFKP